MLQLRDIEDAQQSIRDWIYHSPCVRTQSLSQACGCHVYLKMENLQMTGSFKERGALNKLRSLDPAVLQRGVVAASAGNHAQGVAYHANRMNCPSIIVMPEQTPLNKVASTRRFGAKVTLRGRSYDEAYKEALSMSETEGLPFIHAFDDYKIMAGQGTIGLEILEDNVWPDAVLIPIGGGGLISGIAVAIKERLPRCQIIGVQMQRSPGMKRSLEAGQVTDVESLPSLADGITVKRVGELTFPVVQRYVDDIALVDEEEVAAAILTLLETEKCLVEGAGAAPLAALTYRDLGLSGKRVALVLSGGNIDMNQLSRIIERGQIKDGRMAKLRIELQDSPGQLAKVSACIAEYRANVLEVYHNRSFFDGPLGGAYLDITVETRGRDHVEEVQRALEDRGYRVQPL